MLTTNEVMAFLATADADSATLFYRDRLGLRLVAETEFALEFEAGDALTNLRVQKVAAVIPTPYTALGWKVGNIAEKVEALSKRGIAFERFDGLEQDQHGIWQAPGGGRIAWFKDPDGNILSLVQLAPVTAPPEPTQPIT
jgi:catechol 2,3-dioxygenase-like lactoylglutathione lyase family enzyme